MDRTLKRRKISERDARIYCVVAAFEEPDGTRWRITEFIHSWDPESGAGLTGYVVARRGLRDGRFREVKTFSVLQSAIAFIEDGYIARISSREPA